MAYPTATELRAELGAKYTEAAFPDALLERLTRSFAEMAFDYRGIAYEPTTAVEEFEGAGRCTFVLNEHAVTAVTSVKVDGVELDADAWRLRPNGIVRLATPTTRSGSFDPVVTVTYTHGLAVTPQLAIDACIEYVRAAAMASRSDKPRDVVFTSKDGFVSRYVTPDKDKGRPTGWTEVDRLLNDLPDMRTPAVA